MRDRRRDHPRARARRGCAPQCARIILNANGDPARFAVHRPAGRRRRACRISPGRSPAFWPGSTGRRAHAPDIAMDRERAGRLPVPAARSGGAAARGARAARARRSPARARASGAIRWSGCGRSTLRDDLRHALVDEGLAQDRGLDRAPRRRDRRLAGPTPVDPFFNVNTPEDAAAAERIAAQHARR